MSEGTVHPPLSGRVALVTGSSRGIGRAIALELADRGADIVVNYLRKRSAAGEVVARIEDKGRRAIAVRANVGDFADIEAMFEQVRSQFGRCDILVGNAASGVLRPITQMEDKHWDWTLDINARSILRCARLAPDGGARVGTDYWYYQLRQHTGFPGVWYRRRQQGSH